MRLILLVTMALQRICKGSKTELPRLNRKCYIIIWILIILLVPYLYYQLTFQVSYQFRHENVNLPCALPKLNPFDKSVMQFVYHPEPLKCDTAPSLVYVDTQGYLRLNVSALTYYKEPEHSIRCKYSSVIRNTDDAHVSFSKLLAIQFPFRVKSDFFRISCFNKDSKSIYDSLHTNIFQKKPVDKIGQESRDHLSVFMFGIDSISRSAAIRKLPRTYDYLINKLKAYEFRGYMKVGENTLPNLTPLLTGKRVWSDEVPIKDYTKEPFDPFPFLWKNYSDAKSATLYAEDWPEFGTFNYLTRGFVNPPTDHYMRPFWLALQEMSPVGSALEPVFLFLEDKKLHLQGSSSMCIGNTPKHMLIVNYLKQFVSHYKEKRRFAFTFVVELAHEYQNMIELADNDFQEFFSWLKSGGHLENSVLVFFSDHGARIDKIRNTFAGRIEDRMPIVTLVIPEFLKERYPHLHENLERNQDRLATPFDLHETLVDVLKNNFSSNWQVPTKNPPRGISFFNQIPKTRSCAEAWIPDHYCACYKSLPVNISTHPVVKPAANVVLKWLNNFLKQGRPKCALLEIERVVDASKMSAGLKHTTTQNKGISLLQFFKPEEKIGERYLLVIETRPGNALFEGTVEYNDVDVPKIIGDINRINKYGNQSSCIQQKRLRPYCFCV